MNDSQQALSDRISQFSFDEGTEQLTFARRLARENSWPLEYTHRVIEEYKRFMFLAVSAGHPVTPSDQIDQVWHLHLTYTRSYWGPWCQEVLRKAIHHGPTKGGTAEGQKFQEWYENTRQSYRVFFGERPPEDIWPDASIRFGLDIYYQRINTKTNWVLPKPWYAWKRPIATATFPVLAAAIGVPLFAQQGYSDTTGGVICIAFFFFLFLFIFVIAAIEGNKKKSGRRSDSSTPGGDSGDSGDSGCWGFGDSGCGGGGCGGGGCGGGGGD